MPQHISHYEMIEQLPGYSVAALERLLLTLPETEPSVTGLWWDGTILKRFIQPMVLDSMSPMAAYSPARQLLTAYSGPLFVVRRASDDAVLDIHFDESGLLDEAAIATFCGASIGWVTTLFDQSGNNHHLYNAELLKQWRIWNGSSIYKLNSVPVFFSSGVAGYMNVADGFTFTELSSCGVARWTLANAALYQFGAVNTAGSLVFNTSLQAYALVLNGGASIAHATGTFNQIAATITAANRRIWKDGVEGTPNATASTLNAANVGLNLGAISTTLYGMAGYFGDQVFFDREITEGERLAVSENQQSFFGTP